MSVSQIYLVVHAGKLEQKSATQPAGDDGAVEVVDELSDSPS